MKVVRLSQIACALLALALPIAILADLNQTVTLLPNTSLNLDTGAVVSSGGDLLWNGITLLPPGTAKVTVTGLTPSSVFDSLNQQAIMNFAPQATNAAISSASLNPGTILAAFTNAGHPAKVQVKGTSPNSLTLQFTTFGVAGGPIAPAVTNVLNNSSEIPAGFSNSGIAQGSLFKVLGSDLANDGDATLHDSQAPGGLPITLNGATIMITASDNSTRQPSLYYATPSQIDGVLPANTPPGPGTLTVTRGGTTSSSFPIEVVAAAPGITTFNGSGVAQDASRLTDSVSGLLTYTKSAAPGAVIILWGTGLGPTVDNDTAYTATPHQTSVPYTIYIGGVAANIAYAGRSVYPGVGVIGVTIPQNVPTGCSVPVAAVATVGGTTVVSNIVTIPIHAGGGTCTDPPTGVTGDLVSQLIAQSTVNTGSVTVTQATIPNGSGSITNNNVTAVFQQVAGTSFHPAGTVSIGSCLLTQTLSGSTGTSTPLSAGVISVTGPDGAPVILNPVMPANGVYRATLSSIPSTGGSFVFKGAGANGGVGSFSTTVNFPNPLLSWANQSAAATITRSQGLSVTWTGGSPGSYVTITGNSASGTLTGSYTCFAPQAAGQFTVPAYILQALPSGSGSTAVSDAGNVTSFSATGLDVGTATGTVSVTVNSTYN